MSKAIDKQRYDTTDKLRVTSWMADVAERNGVTRADVDARLGTSDMGGWWLSRLPHRCAVPTLEQVPAILDALRVEGDDVPDDIRRLLLDLNGRKGQPGDAWFRREVLAVRSGAQAESTGRYGSWGNDDGTGRSVFAETAPVKDAARDWDGWGTALKPSHEPIVVARKPLVGTVAANVQRFGTGGLNIDATRIGWGSEGDKSAERKAKGYSDAAKAALGSGNRAEQGMTGEVVGSDASAGRWPANTILVHSDLCVRVGTRRVKGDRRSGGDGLRPGGFADVGSANGDGRPAGALYGDADGMEETEAWECVPQCPVRQLDEQSGNVRGAVSNGRRAGNGAMFDPGEAAQTPSYGDKGGASRFMYCAKASTRERNAGLPEGERNGHPTVKAVEVMRWLVRLVTPPNGLVLDPFAGSGTTGIACVLEGKRFIGIEQDAEYANIARARIGWWHERGEDALRVAPKTGRSSTAAEPGPEREESVADPVLDSLF